MWVGIEVLRETCIAVDRSLAKLPVRQGGSAARGRCSAGCSALASCRLLVTPEARDGREVVRGGVSGGPACRADPITAGDGAAIAGRARRRWFRAMSGVL